jgi:hypothetical protein
LSGNSNSRGGVSRCRSRSRSRSSSRSSKHWTRGKEEMVQREGGGRGMDVHNLQRQRPSTVAVLGSRNGRGRSNSNSNSALWRNKALLQARQQERQLLGLAGVA